MTNKIFKGDNPSNDTSHEYSAQMKQDAGQFWGECSCGASSRRSDEDHANTWVTNHGKRHVAV
ncbi:hypothetical protein [Nakamurella leprariae]|uniref:Uncharacterized protein n=1 Tax=Nakamurella leprariae TaxID=2803911 RepID=A0A939BYE3_9ACTN|nr:hypothetical protein [Nakamurella leprariae]MBM9467005.1 hypothetical protein [Nakamurella leprariae]